jgi:hypothetical protein
MSSIQSDALNRARATIENSWDGIAEIYTVAWMGPIEAVEAIFDHITKAISDIQRMSRASCHASFTRVVRVHQKRRASRFLMCRVLTDTSVVWLPLIS